MTGSAKQSTAAHATLDCFVAEPVVGPAQKGRTRWLLAMTLRHESTFSRRNSPELCISCHPRKDRGCREGRVTACTRGLRAKGLREARVDHRYSGISPAFPAQRFTAYSALSSVNQRLPPSPARCLWSFARLGACMGAPGPHGFAVRFRAARQSARPASAAFRSTFVTIAIRPLCRCGMGAVNHEFRKNERRIFLREGLDRANQVEPKSEIRRFAQARGGLVN